MKFQVKPLQAFLIFSMLFAETDEEREPSFSAAPIKKAPRDELEKAGLIKFEKRGPRSHIVLTDEAWDWAANNLGVELPKTARAARLLSTVLKKLSRFAEANDFQLRDYVSGEPAPERESPDTPATEAAPAPIEDQVRSACLDLARGATKARVRLTDLRK
ncbi:MAG TPA: hypothetical protein VK524_09260, partial [Polyangiaceae bacterium]|nr:hypothetical protein [Polyangiaceae bacterium]